MRTLRLCLAGTVIVVLLGGMGGAAVGQPDEAVLPSSGCEVPLAEPGDYAASYVVGDSTAKYWVVVPETYAQEAPIPLVLWLSSGDGDADTHYVGWKPYLDDIGELFVVVGKTGAWDVDALVSLIDQLTLDYCIDPRRVHVMGSSSSAYALAKLVCQESGRIASFQGSMGLFKPVGCVPERPVPLTALTGGNDRTAVGVSVAQWAAWNGCEAEPLVEDLGSGVSRHAYQDCAADVVLLDIEGAGHNFVFHECIGPAAGYCRAYQEVDQLEEALAFFEQHPLPPAE